MDEAGDVAGKLLGPGRDPCPVDGTTSTASDEPGDDPLGRWGKNVLRDGDIVFRLGDAKALGGTFPLSQFIATATGSRFSHTGIVAVESGSPVVYDCSSAGVQRQPFEVWMLDCVGAMGVKRLKPEYRNHIPGILGYCRAKFEQQVPFDFEFRPDDAAFYCVELTEKAFRSQGLKLSEPVRIGDWEHLGSYPLTALATPYVTKLFLDQPITLEQPVYVPGNDHEGVWSSSLLETVYGPEPKPERETDLPRHNRVSLRGDLELIGFAGGELRRLASMTTYSGEFVESQRPAVVAIAIPSHDGRITSNPANATHTPDQAEIQRSQPFTGRR